MTAADLLMVLFIFGVGAVVVALLCVASVIGWVIERLGVRSVGEKP